jgi:hypothetical protein
MNAMTDMTLNDGVLYQIEPTLLKRHGDDSPHSDFQGHQGELLEMFRQLFEKCDDLSSLKQGKNENTFILEGAPADKFRCRCKERTLHGRPKPPAESVDLVVQTVFSRKGQLESVILIDFQAWPFQRKKSAQSEEQQISAA